MVKCAIVLLVLCGCTASNSHIRRVDKAATHGGVWWTGGEAAIDPARRERMERERIAREMEEFRKSATNRQQSELTFVSP